MKQTPRRVTIRCFKLRCDFTDERLLKGAFVFCSYNTSQWDPKHALFSFYCLKAEEFVPLHSAVFPWRLRGEGRLRLVWTNKGDLMLVLLTLSLWKSEIQLKKKRWWFRSLIRFCSRMYAHENSHLQTTVQTLNVILYLALYDVLLCFFNKVWMSLNGMKTTQAVIGSQLWLLSGIRCKQEQIII